MPKTYYYKAITDPVHGSIGLSKLEAAVVSSRAFQRLHNVKQLGLAHLVYPGANYSRFSHSVGACHNAGRLLSAIHRSSPGADITDEKIRAYRLAGLLHDIGHYPFSHATEHVVKNFYKKQSFLVEAGSASAQAQGDTNASGDNYPPSFDHEKLGEIIIQNDEELKSIFEKHDFDVASVVKIFGKTPDPLIGLISSDLDCDRLDYLRRTAHHSGVPYGSVDIDYIVDQAMVTKDGSYAFNVKAMRAADHLLISRYYDYMQVPYNKTVAGLEWSLVTCLEVLLQRGMLDCSSRAIVDCIRNGEWPNFDDQHVYQLFRSLAAEMKTATDVPGKILRDHVNSVLSRRPPKMVAAWEAVSERKDAKRHGAKVDQAETGRAELAAKFGIPQDRLYVWKLTLNLTKFGAGTSENLDDGQLATSVTIYNPLTNSADLLTEHPDALLHHLAECQFSGVRVYYLPEDGRDEEALRRELCLEFEKRLGPCTAA